MHVSCERAWQAGCRQMTSLTGLPVTYDATCPLNAATRSGVQRFCYYFTFSARLDICFRLCLLQHRVIDILLDSSLQPWRP